MATTKQDKGVTMADTAALAGTPDASADQDTPQTPAERGLDASQPIDVKYEDGGDGQPFMSEGMRHDIYTHGKAVDPANGRVVIPA